MFPVMDKIPLKCDCVDECLVNGITQKIFYSLVPEEPGYKVVKNTLTIPEETKLSFPDQITFFTRINTNAE